MSDTPTMIAGVPIDEALRVLAIYRTTGVEPNKDYFHGFMAGYTAAHKEVQRILDETVMRIIKEDE